MSNDNIKYRGAETTEAELEARKQEQLQQQQGEREIQYRGAKDKVDTTLPHPHSVEHVKYRGAEDDVDVEH